MSAVLEFVQRAGLAAPGENPHVLALSGGVSSDIWRVDLASGPVCVKRALARLRVAQLWEAPVERNGYERQWMESAARAVPGAAPRILAVGDSMFAMEYLPPSRYLLWKEELSRGRADAGFAARVGSSLVAIHAANTGADIARKFATDEIFYAIRLEPYLVATGRAHADLAPQLENLVKRTAQTKRALVHGDVSPKNILAGPDGPVFLDAECAWYGDPAFDLAFCLNHLLLKCLWVPQATPRYLECFDALARAYLRGVQWEEPPGLEARAASLLPALLLARVDGKSPVEYLTQDAQKQTVRDFARAFIAQPPRALFVLRDAWQESLT